MAGVTGNKDARRTHSDLAVGHIVESIAESLADLVDRPPGNLLHVECVRMEDPLRCGDQIVHGDVALRDPFVLVELVEFDVNADEVAAFPRDDETLAFVRGLDERLDADVRKIRDGEHVHDAPRLIG